MLVYLCKSSNSNKKYQVTIGNKTVHFGAIGYSDYTKHKSAERKRQYIIRHRTRENWSKSGIRTAGFWSRWLLWNKPTIKASIRDIESRFSITIKRCYKK